MNFLTKQVGPLPVWGYGIILLGVGVGFIFLRGKLNTGQAAAVPQVNSAVGNDNMPLPLPYPNPGSGAVGVPPSATFDTSGAGLQGGYLTPTGNFTSDGTYPSNPLPTPRPVPPLLPGSGTVPPDSPAPSNTLSGRRGGNAYQ